MNDITLEYLQSAANMHSLMRAHGYTPVISQRLLSAALEAHPYEERSRLVEKAINFFRTYAVIVPQGIDQLPPAAWLAGLPNLLWASRRPHWHEIPYMIRRLAFDDAVLCITYAKELPTVENRLTGWDRLRIKINLGLSPNLWHPLPDHLVRLLWNNSPNLRSDLFPLPN